MADEKLICGCGGEITVSDYKRWQYLIYAFRCYNNPKNCPVFITVRVDYPMTALEEKNKYQQAIAAFRKATRADIKQRIQWISVKVRLPDVYVCNNFLSKRLLLRLYNEHGDLDFSAGQYDFTTKKWLCDTVYQDITHWAEINPPADLVWRNKNV